MSNLVIKEMDPATFAARVRERREALGMSQAELGLAVGGSQQAVNNWEAGRTEKTGSIVELARALRTTPEWLQFGEETTASPRDLYNEMIDVLRLVELTGVPNEVLTRVVRETIAKAESAR